MGQPFPNHLEGYVLDEDMQDIQPSHPQAGCHQFLKDLALYPPAYKVANFARDERLDGSPGNDTEHQHISEKEFSIGIVYLRRNGQD